MPPYDVILYGATGFTGQQAALYFDARAPRSLRWAIAGRSAEKLAALRARLSHVGGVVVADSGDVPSVDRMVGQARVLLTTAGPFARYGEPVVAACARLGVDYVDITGETPFVRRMIDRYHEAARASGAKVIPFCGFDSVPSDLGAFWMVQALRERGQGCRHVAAFFRAKGGFNGGTLASALAMLEDPEGASSFRDPWLLNPAAHHPPPGAEAPADLPPPRREAMLGGRWSAPFFMAPVNTRVVRRSAALAADLGEPYGEGFSYREAMGPLSMPAALGLSAGMGVAWWGGRVPLLRRLARRLGPDPGEGPSEEVMDNGFMRVRYHAEGEGGLRLQGEWRAAGDPGNRVTVRLLCECALALATQRDELPGGAERAGLLTPATALGGVLLRRLQQAGVEMTLQEA